MISFDISYHNVDRGITKNIFNHNKNLVNEINQIVNNLDSLNISKDLNDIEEIKNATNKFLKNKNKIIVFGTGGSNLGARALINILYEFHSNKIIFLDNVDPIYFKNIIMNVDLKKTGFIIISKSGTTPETLSQFSTIIEILDKKNITQDLSNNCIIITEDKDSPLKKIADIFSIKTLDHNKNIGGRYSVFSNVGLLPAYIAGLDIIKIREGASSLISHYKHQQFEEPIIGGFLINYLQANESVNLNVLMTYSESLFYFGKWYLQLWAESIGKKNKGTTPIHSVGTIDQHSQLQLYLDGPRDKFFTLITSDHQGKGLIMNKKILLENNVRFLAGKNMGDLMYAAQKATLHTLIKNKLPVREIYCKKIDEFSIGQLMAYFMIETISACLFIGVDPFTQPSVEQGKKLTKEYLLK